MSKLQKVNFKTKNNQEVCQQPLIVELTFLSSVSKKYCCVLCHSLLQDASQVTCCKANYCRDCIDRLTATTGKCSNCGKNYSIITDGVVEDLRKKIQQMKVRCINEGCRWTGSIEQLEKVHLANPRYDERDTTICQYQEVPCPNECGACVSRLNMRDHRFLECEKEMGACEYCGMEMNYSQIHKVHHRMCLAIPVECPNKCLTTDVARADILKHLEEECLLRLVSCDYRHVGCEDKFQFRDLKGHNIQCYQKHLDLMAEKLVFVGNENEELHSENDRLQNEITILLSKLKNFQAGLETADDILNYYTVMNSVNDTNSSGVPGPSGNPVGYYSVEGADSASGNPVGYYSVKGADDTEGYISTSVPTPKLRNADPVKRRERSKSMFLQEVAGKSAAEYQNIRKRASEIIPEVDETNIYESIDNIVDPAAADSRNPALFPKPKEASIPLPQIPKPRLRSTLSVPVPNGSYVPLPEPPESSLSEPGYTNGSCVPLPEPPKSSLLEPSYINERTSSVTLPGGPKQSTSDREETSVYSVPRNANATVSIVPKRRVRFSTASIDSHPSPSPSPDVEGSPLPPETPSAKPRRRASVPSKSQDDKDTKDENRSSGQYSNTPVMAGTNGKQPTSPAALRHTATAGTNSKQPASPPALHHTVTAGTKGKQPTSPAALRHTVMTGTNSKQPTSPATLRHIVMAGANSKRPTSPSATLHHVDDKQDLNQIYEVIDEIEWKNPKGVSSNPANESSSSDTASSKTTEVPPVLIDFTDGDYQSFKMMKRVEKGTKTTSGQSSGATGGGSEVQESHSSTYPIPYLIPVTGSGSVPRQRSQTVVDGDMLSRSLRNAKVNRKLVDAVMGGSEIPNNAHGTPPLLPPKNGSTCETTDFEAPKMLELGNKSASLMDLLADYDFPTTSQTQNLIPLPPKQIQVPSKHIENLLDLEPQDSKIGSKPDAKTVLRPSIMPKPGSKTLPKPGPKPSVMSKPGSKPNPGSKPVTMPKPSSTLPRLNSNPGTSKTEAGTVLSPKKLRHSTTSLSSSGGSDEMKQKLERIFSNNK